MLDVSLAGLDAFLMGTRTSTQYDAGKNSRSLLQNCPPEVQSTVQKTSKQNAAKHGRFSSAYASCRAIRNRNGRSFSGRPGARTKAEYVISTNLKAARNVHTSKNLSSQVALIWDRTAGIFTQEWTTSSKFTPQTMHVMELILNDQRAKRDMNKVGHS